MNELDIYSKLQTIGNEELSTTEPSVFHQSLSKVEAHRVWLKNIRHERPSTNHKFKVGIYIRYFNQTKYEDYLSYHKKQFLDTMDLCVNWTLVDFYIDEGASAPHMETAPEWSRLLDDCMSGKIDLIITQKISNVSKKTHEVTLCARLLAAQNPPVGIYFISEDLFTLASYYRDDLKDTFFLPTPDWTLLPEPEEERGCND